MKLSDANYFQVTFSLQNWNWLSRKVKFTSIIQTMDQLYGKENLTATIDFTEIPEEDIEYYTPGGRVYMGVSENSINFNLNSFGFFFEIEGYVEPLTKVDIWFILIAVGISLLFAGFLGLVIYCYARRWYKKKQLLKEADAEE